MNSLDARIYHDVLLVATKSTNNLAKLLRGPDEGHTALISSSGNDQFGST